MSNLFVYGILREEETLKRFAPDWNGSMHPARLHHHFVIRNIGPAYAFPSLDERDFIEGTLITDIDPAAFVRLDKLEGTATRHYDRVSCTVELANGKFVATEFYRAGPWAASKLSTSKPKEAKRLDSNIYTVAAPSTEPPLLAAPGPYPNTADHLPGRIGVPLPRDKRGYVSEAGPLGLFTCHADLLSIDRIEIITGHEWFGTRRFGYLPGMRMSATHPQMLVKSKGDNALGYVVTGLYETDIEAIDRYMRVEDGYQTRIEADFGDSITVYAYVAGSRKHDLQNAARKNSMMGVKVRKAANRIRAAQAKEAASIFPIGKSRVTIGIDKRTTH